MMKLIGHIGERVRQKVALLTRLLRLLGAVIWVALQPRYWPATVRNVLVRQVLFTGVEAFRFVGVTALICGVSVVMQAQVWLVKFGQSHMLGPLLVAVVVRELGPLLTCLLVVGRSGTAIAAELASMRVSGQIELLDAQGIDPFTYLLMPRVVGVAVAVFCLSVVFLVVCLAGGFLTGALLGVGGTPLLFAEQVAQSVSPADVVAVLAKTIISGLLTGVICCDVGFAVENDLADIPRATTLGQIRSLLAVFITFFVVSVVMYV